MRQVMAVVLVFVLFTGSVLGEVGSIQSPSMNNTGLERCTIPKHTPIFLILAQTTGQTPATPVLSMADGYMAGRISAESRGTGSSFAGGFVCGLLTGLIGTAVLWGVTNGDDVPAHMISLYQGRGNDYSMGFINGYNERTKQKKRSARLGGGLLGTAAIVVLVLSSSSGSN